jgi:hypothetical protein
MTDGVIVMLLTVARAFTVAKRFMAQQQLSVNRPLKS